MRRFDRRFVTAGSSHGSARLVLGLRVGGTAKKERVIPNLCLCDESVSRGRMTGTKGRRTGTIGTKGRTEGTKERGNEKPYGLVQIEYLDRGTSTRHVWTWRGRVTLFLDV